MGGETLSKTGNKSFSTILTPLFFATNFTHHHHPLPKEMKIQSQILLEKIVSVKALNVFIQ